MRCVWRWNSSRRPDWGTTCRRPPPWCTTWATPGWGSVSTRFHFAVGPSKTEDLAYLTPANLFHVQLSDLADRLRETAADRDRILPGDGDLPLTAIVRHLRAIDYQARCRWRS